MNRSQILAALENNAVKISTRGFAINQFEISAGDSLSLVYLSTKEESLAENTISKFIDERRSGDYLIMETKHIFTLTDHYVNMKISKLSSVSDKTKEVLEKS